MKDLIISAIKNSGPLTITDLEQRAAKRGMSLDELDAVLEQVHKDKRIKVSTDLTYRYEEPPTAFAKQMSHVTWVNENYPWPTDFEMPFPEIDISWMFLKTKDERDAFLAGVTLEEWLRSHRYRRRYSRR